MIVLVLTWVQLMTSRVSACGPTDVHDEVWKPRGRVFIMDRKYFCGAYVQYDVVLAEQLEYENYSPEDIPIVVSEIVKNLFTVANAVISKTDSKYLKNMVFYARHIKRKPVREIGVDEFVRKAHVDNGQHFCFLVHISATRPGRRRDFLGFGNVGSVCNAHRIGSTSRALQGMAMSVDVSKLRSATHVHELTFIHELGHVLGAEHDGLAELIVEGTSCPVWDLDPENNIMFYRSREKFHVQQRSFSQCSIRQMDNTLESIFESGAHKTCFSSFGAHICGNGMVEEGEQCDCGFSEELCAEDKCCHPAVISEWNRHAKPCTYRNMTPRAQCSVSNGPCCDGTTCQFRARGTLCEAESPCREASYCTGDSAVCPAQEVKPNKIRCENDATCVNGTCKGSLCDLYNLTSCAPSRASPEELCKTFCLSPRRRNRCLLLCKIEKKESCGRFLPPGFECANGQGTCDFRGHCFRTKRTYFWRKFLTVLGILLLMGAYFHAIIRILPMVPHGNFARSRAADKLERRVLNYVERLRELEVHEDS